MKSMSFMIGIVVLCAFSASGGELAAAHGRQVATEVEWQMAKHHEVEQVAPGVWRIRLGTPEKFTPVTLQKKTLMTDALREMAPCDFLPFSPADVRFHAADRGCTIQLPMQAHEQIYGFGLQLKSLNHTGTRKVCRVSDDQSADLGDSHAPVPFYVTNLGYGVLVDTARYVSFYCGNLHPVSAEEKAPDASPREIATSTEQLYTPRKASSKSMTIEVPTAKGVDVYVFGGPTTQDAVRRYVLFSGGGCLPPLWGLGMYYRGFSQFNADDVLKLAREFRQEHIPCDVFGLEPGWHSHAYSCTYVWSKERWPDPDGFINAMDAMGFKLNLWEHAFVHPSSPLYAPMKPFAGNYLVWEGLVPDFTLPDARKLFADYHEQNLVNKGIAGFKLDECDNQPISKSPWSFPELSSFPSGIDGEQMHSLLGVLYQETLNAVFVRNNLRTYSKVRASHAMASSLPFVIYSDHYDHRDYVRGLATSGFSGLLWQPEVREAASLEDLYRRIQTAVFSPQAVVDAWFLRNPPWKQINRDKNNNGELLPNRAEVQAVCLDLFKLRMRLIPYLYSAFADYRNKGIPPFRAVVMDYPEDPNTLKLDDEYLMGPSMLVAPLFAGQAKRSVYLPEGAWYDFWSHEKYDGKRRIDVEMPLDKIPVFINGGSLVPMAEPVEQVAPETCFQITVLAFGSPCRDFSLYEDDGLTYDFERGHQNVITLSWSRGKNGHVKKIGGYKGPDRYKIADWRKIL